MTTVILTLTALLTMAIIFLSPQECWAHCDWENDECPEHCRGDDKDGKSCREHGWAEQFDDKCGDRTPYDESDERLNTIGNDADSCCGPPNCVAHCDWEDAEHLDNCPTDCDTSKCAEDGVFPKSSVDAFIAGGCKCSEHGVPILANEHSKTYMYDYLMSVCTECWAHCDWENGECPEHCRHQRNTCREHMWAEEDDGNDKCGDRTPFEKSDERLNEIGNDALTCCDS
jgi:hypothetical protein